MSRERHTLVSGFSGAQQQMSEPLQLHLENCVIRASNQTGILMQQSDQLLMLGEGSSQAQHLAVVTCGPGETREATASAFGSVSGTAHEFVASYGKKNVPLLSLSRVHSNYNDTCLY